MTSSRSLAALAAAASMALVSCGGSGGGEEAAPPDPAATQGMSILFPTDGTLKYLSGYDSVGGTIYTTPCMARGTDIEKDVSADPFANAYKYEMKMVESKSELYDFLNVSYQTEVKYVVGKNQTAVDMSNQFRHESESIYVVVKSTWDGPVFTHKNPVFTESRAEFLAEYPTYREFVNACGDSFALSVQSGMHFYGMFKFTFSSTSERNVVRAKLYNKTLAVKTSKEFSNEIGYNTSSSSVEVMARIVGGGPNALDVSTVRTADDFFDFVDKYAQAEKQAIKDGKADGLKSPDPNLAFGYAVHAVVVPYQPYLRSQYGLPTSWFSGAPGGSWANLAPLSRLYAAQIDAYNQLDNMVRNPWLFGSTSVPGKSLTDAEVTELRAHRDKFKASASPDDPTRGLQALMLLCSGPDDVQLINTGGATYSDVATPFNGTARKFCRTRLYANDAANADDCDGLAICAAMYDKLQAAKERDRLPFFTLNTVASDGDSGQPKAIVDANQSTVKVLPAPMASVPQDCAALKNASPKALSDGDYTVYFMGRADQPYTVSCKGLDTSAPKTYLKLDPAYVSENVVNNTQHPKYNYTMNTSQVGSQSARQFRTFWMYRLVTTPDGVAIDTTDLTYSWPYDPNGVPYQRHTVFSGRSAFNLPLDLNIDLTRTGLSLRTDNTLQVTGWGHDSSKPSVQFHTYPGAGGVTYVQGVSAWLQADPAWLELQSPDRLWLGYVPAAATTNAGNGSLSPGKTIPVTNGLGGWCQGQGSWGACPNPVFLISLRQLLGS